MIGLWLSQRGVKMITRLNLLSRYRFVTTKEQLEDLIAIATDEKKSKELDGELLLVDSFLLVNFKRGVSTKLSTACLYLLAQIRKLNFGTIIVANAGTRLDKRLELQVTHRARIVSSPLESPKMEL